MTEIVQRYEDMSVRGKLRLIQQDDGDIIVCVQEQRDDGLISPGESVEFCASGGKSYRTLHALRALMDAMKLDNADVPWRNPDADTTKPDGAGG